MCLRLDNLRLCRLHLRHQSKLEMPKSYNPLVAYIGTDIPPSQMANSPRLNQLVRDGKLYISLQDAISLALENNLDLAIARYNLPIADTDILRTKAGGVFRGVNTGVVQGTPGGGIGGLGSGAPGRGRRGYDWWSRRRRRGRIRTCAIYIGRWNIRKFIRPITEHKLWC